jgi:hypothetical protein
MKNIFLLLSRDLWTNLNAINICRNILELREIEEKENSLDLNKKIYGKTNTKFSMGIRTARCKPSTPLASHQDILFRKSQQTSTEFFYKILSNVTCDFPIRNFQTAFKKHWLGQLVCPWFFSSETRKLFYYYMQYQ